MLLPGEGPVSSSCFEPSYTFVGGHRNILCSGCRSTTLSMGRAET